MGTEDRIYSTLLYLVSAREAQVSSSLVTGFRDPSAVNVAVSARVVWIGKVR